MLAFPCECEIDMQFEPTCPTSRFPAHRPSLPRERHEVIIRCLMLSELSATVERPSTTRVGVRMQGVAPRQVGDIHRGPYNVYAADGAARIIAGKDDSRSCANCGRYATYSGRMKEN